MLQISGLRSDGRKPDEIRRISTGLGTFDDCDGSAYLEMGNTKVQAVVYFPCVGGITGRYGPRNSSKPRAMKRTDATVSSTVTISPFATVERRMVSRSSKTTAEFSLAISRCFENVIITSLYPQSEIAIHCTILSADGGELSCCLNAALLAVIDAGIAVIDFQVSIEVGYMDNTVIYGLGVSLC